jgi:NAD+ synthase (glutamine-hydrolysing)
MESFASLYSHDFVRIASCVPRTKVADVPSNLAETIRMAKAGSAAGVAVMVFPELGLSSYAIDDLLFQDALMTAVEAAIDQLVDLSRDLYPVLIVGAPLRYASGLFNTAVVIHRGSVLGIVPKTYLPNYREFYEKRHFTAGAGIRGGKIGIVGHQAPFGVDLLFRSIGTVDVTFHVELCEDFWAPLPPSTAAALAGAEVLINLSASNVTIGKADTRRLLCASQSARAIAAYAYSAAGPGESTTDLAWDGHAAVFEHGELLGETERFAKDSAWVTADVDLGRIRQERMRFNTFGDCAREESRRTAEFRTISFQLDAPNHPVRLERMIERFPFVPSDPGKLREQCYEAYNIQVQGLATRLQAAKTEWAVIGISGGLDSTQALVVAARAMDRLDLPRSNVLAYTLPGFATSEQTKSNAWALIRALGVAGSEIDIRPTARQMLTDLKHPFARGEPVYDITFENVQAGLRTDYLFRLANQNHGLVVGTGDLSELALGWCTYGVGDQMSHYNVNASVAKTLIQHLIRFVAGSGDVSDDTARILQAVLDTQISPELVPAETSGMIQSSEQTIGPYPLQDFNLFYLTRHGFRPSKIAFLAHHAWVMSRAAYGRRISRTPAGGPMASAKFAIGWRCFCNDFSPTSSSAQHCRMDRKCPRAARCRRAVIGGCRPMPTRVSGSPSLPTTCLRSEPWCADGIAAEEPFDDHAICAGTGWSIELCRRPSLPPVCAGGNRRARQAGRAGARLQSRRARGAGIRGRRA